MIFNKLKNYLYSKKEIIKKIFKKKVISNKIIDNKNKNKKTDDIYPLW